MQSVNQVANYEVYTPSSVSQFVYFTTCVIGNQWVYIHIHCASHVYTCMHACHIISPSQIQVEYSNLSSFCSSVSKDLA